MIKFLLEVFHGISRTFVDFSTLQKLCTGFLRLLLYFYYYCIYCTITILVTMIIKIIKPNDKEKTRLLFTKVVKRMSLRTTKNTKSTDSRTQKKIFQSTISKKKKMFFFENSFYSVVFVVIFR